MQVIEFDKDFDIPYESEGDVSSLSMNLSNL